MSNISIAIVYLITSFYQIENEVFNSTKTNLTCQICILMANNEEENNNNNFRSNEKEKRIRRSNIRFEIQSLSEKSNQLFGYRVLRLWCVAIFFIRM